MKKLLLLTLVLAMVCGFNLATSAKSMFLASAFERDHILVQMGYRFKDLVEKYTDGGITVKISPGGAMGGETALIEQTSAGLVDGTLTGTQPISLYAKEYYWFSTPYVLKDFAVSKSLWDSELGGNIKETVLKNGNIRILNLVYRGSRNMTSNIKFYTPQQLVKEKVKLRLPIIPEWVNVWKEIGANIATVDLSELFSAVQMGVADATEGPAPQILTVHLDEVQKYLIMTSHQVSTGNISLNEDYYQSLTKEEQAAVNRAAREAGEWASSIQAAKENQQIVELQEKGMTVIIPDKQAFLDAAKPALEKMFAERWAGEYKDVEPYINSF
ncbi:MAG: TRAP transporter substrate-binding protein [Halanaerobiales bacterium]|nr:TRAP transporter substrate-binding protein [Halanaerobiales bacterium]